MYTYPEGIEEVVSALQQQLQRKIANAGIAIECNPSSNLKIGPFDSYTQHPIFAFRRNDLKASINTDDKGIFSTSLYNEYSLIAARTGNRAPMKRRSSNSSGSSGTKPHCCDSTIHPPASRAGSPSAGADLPSDRTSN